MKTTYTLRTDTVRSDLEQPITVYGINVDGSLSIPDIFTSKPDAEKFIFLCNRLNLSPDHIYEVIDDVL